MRTFSEALQSVSRDIISWAWLTQQSPELISLTKNTITDVLLHSNSRWREAEPVYSQQSKKLRFQQKKRERERIERVLSPKQQLLSCFWTVNCPNSLLRSTVSVGGGASSDICFRNDGGVSFALVTTTANCRTSLDHSSLKQTLQRRILHFKP